jgi:predicted RNA-binding protein YlxR (DUF448 family)
MTPTQKKLLRLAHKKTGNVFYIYMNSTNTRYISFEKEKPETNKKTVTTLHETQDNNNTHHKPFAPCKASRLLKP